MYTPFFQRRQKYLRRASLWVLLAVSVAAPAMAADPDITLTPRPRWTNLFSDHDTVFAFEITSPESIQGELLVALVANGRTLVTGRVAVKLDDAKPTAVEVKLHTPPLAEGVVFPCEVLAKLVRPKNQEANVEQRWPAWLFAADPFHDQRKWLEKLEIALWDPDGKTAEVLKTADVPFTLIAQRRLLEQRTAGVMLVGEGLELQSDRTLVRALLEAAKRGVCVICLAPADGRFPLADADADEAEPPVKRMTLQREEWITQLDKRLDPTTWSREQKMALSGIALAAERGQVVLQVENTAASFPWLELQFPAAGGRLIVCGWGVVRHWDETPTPRYFLKTLLETVDKARNAEPPREDQPEEK